MVHTIGGTLRAVLILLIMAGSAHSASENISKPPHGLMWNRTGLPSVFPLQVKTAQDSDYVMVLSDPDTETDVLAAFIEGGEFFRVLVPPGSYNVRFSSGGDWRGDDAMFWEGETRLIEMPDTLTFEVRGLRTKGGHLIDLTQVKGSDLADLRVMPELICQRIVWVTDRCGDRLRPANTDRIGCDRTDNLRAPDLGREFTVRRAVCPEN